MGTLAAKTMKQKEALLEQLVKYPIIETACSRAGVGRSTYYDWMRKDKEFAELAEVALNQGIGYINDMAESMLIKNIQGGNNTSLIFWLKNHHKGYNERVIHDHRYSIGGFNDNAAIFTPEEIEAATRALNLAGYAGLVKKKKDSIQVDYEAVEKTLEEEKPIIDEYLSKHEKEEKEHRHRISVTTLGKSEEEFEKEEKRLEEERTIKKKKDGVNLKEFFRKYKEQKKQQEQ